MKNDLSPVDMTLMDVIGYDAAVPEPASLVLLLGLSDGALMRRRCTV